MLDVNKIQHTAYGVDGVGFRVLVHPQSQMPFPNEEGISIAPGLFTYIGLTTVSKL